MVQAAHHWHGEDLAEIVILHRTWNRTVAFQRQMGSRAVIILQVLCKHCLEMSFVEDDEMVQTLPAEGPDQPLHVRTLPRRPRRDQLFQCAETRHPIDELGAVNSIAIAQKIFRRRFERECLDDLLCGSAGRGSLRDGKAPDLPAAVSQDDKAEKYPERRRRHGEEIDRDDLRGVIAQERRPSL